MNLELLFIYILVFFSLFNIFLILLVIFEKPLKRKPYKLDKNLPRVSIIVPAYNEEKNIAKTIKHLLKLKYAKGKLEIIVVDDGSKDKTYEIAKKFEKYGVKVYTKPNGGKASAVNYGIKKAKGEFIATLDADSFPEPNALLKMLPYFEDEKVMAVTPALIVHKPKNIWEKLQHAEYLWGAFLRKVFANINAIHVTPGPLSIYRKEFFEKHGLFDEGNLTEDNEIAMRIQKYNYKIENAIDVKVYTISPKSFKGLLKQRLRWYTGFLENSKKHKQLFNIFKYEFVSFILIMAYISVFMSFSYFVYFSIKNFQLIRDNLRSFSLIGFEIINPTYISGTQIYEAFLNYFTNPLVLLGLFGLTFTILLLIFTKKICREKENIFLNVILFIFVYVIIYNVFWAAVIFNKITKRRVKW